MTPRTSQQPERHLPRALLLRVALLLAFVATPIGAGPAATDLLEVDANSIALVDKISFNDDQPFDPVIFTLEAGAVTGDVQAFTLLNFNLPIVRGAFDERFSFSFFPAGNPDDIGPPARDIPIHRNLVTGHMWSDPVAFRMTFQSGQSVESSDYVLLLTTDPSGVETGGHAPLPIFCELNVLEFSPTPSPLSAGDVSLISAACPVVESPSLASYGVQIELNASLYPGAVGTACSDGVDNDGDTFADFPLDPGCSQALDTSENSNIDCDDGIDNDNDGATDYPDDLDCTSPSDNSEVPVCGDGIVQGSETCDDGNQLNNDCCSSSCSLDPVNTPCSDGSSCTMADVCSAGGSCISGPLLNCDDGIFCNGLESCDDQLGCVNGPDAVVAEDDGISCTVENCNETFDIVTHTPDDAACDDGDICNGVETCDAVLDCRSGTALDVNDGISCTLDFCNSDTQEIAHVPNDFLCNNNLWCDGSESCDAELDCQVGRAPGVDDGVGCTVDSCDEANDRIVHAPDDSACDNGLFCDGTETCDAVLDCQTGPAPADDGISCTVDDCDEGTLAVSNTADDSLCDNGLFCDGVETCDAALDCQAGTPPSEDDGVACTIESCDDVSDSILHTPDDTTCDNGVFCDGAETCDVTLDCQAATPLVLDDGVACTNDSCDEIADAIVHAPDDAACDNGLFCDGAETCDAALDCQAGVAPAEDDGVSCTNDVCNEDLDAFDHLPQHAICSDGDFCNGVEQCDPSLGCQDVAPPEVDDGVSCTLDFCDGFREQVIHQPIHANCNNGLFCDGAETCDATLDCQNGPAPAVDDGVSCTRDQCDEALDRVVNQVDDGLCDNGLFCDGSETCDAVLDCQTGVPPANDGIACTIDSCDEVSDAIVNTPDDGACDNGLFCDGSETCDATLDCQTGEPPVLDDGVECTRDLCNEGQKRVTHNPKDSRCDNGLFCDGAETCDAILDCQAGLAPATDDGIACTIDSCDEVSDAIVNAPDDGMCDNGLFCDGAETCDVALDCQAGPVPVADDGVACTADSCDEIADAIVNAPDDGACDNGLFCDGVETCDAALDCQSGAPPSTDDGVSCTNDACDENSDSITHSPDDAACNNGLFCDGVETCDAALDCQSGVAPILDDGVGCTTDSCDEIADTVVNTPSDAACDNGLFCDGAETCDVALDCQAGTPLVPDDGVACTTDSCDEDADVIVNAPDDAACDNGLFCDGLETCDAALGCQSGAPPSVDDGVSCTADRCDEDADAIVNAPDDSACDNGLFCDGSETCDPSLDCQAGTAPIADDGVACTNDSCDEASDTIVNAPDDNACDNGLFCDGSETCDITLGCQNGTAPVADDGVACTNDSCDEVGDTIVNAPDDSACDNGLFCDGSETCDITLGCQNGTAPVADDGVACTNDSCDEVGDTIVNAPDDSACNNGLFCDGLETCDIALDCQNGTPPETGDAIPCTLDFCDEASDSITHSPQDAECDNGLFCDGDETCHVSLGCQNGVPPQVADAIQCTDDSCDETSDQVLHIPDASQCDDGFFCNGAEVCTPGVGCEAGISVVDDGVPCTSDSCNEAADVVSHTPDDAFCSNGLVCDGTEICDPVLNCVPGDAPAIDDGIACTIDSCTDDGGVLHSPDDSLCNNGLFCDGLEYCDAQLGCQTGSPPVNDDGVACTVDSCDETLDLIVHAADDSLCDNGLFCDGAETCDEILGCVDGTAPVLSDGVGCTNDSCDEVADLVRHEADDSLCDDARFCDGAETCHPTLDCQEGTPPVLSDGVSCTLDECDEAADIVIHTPDDDRCDNGLFCDGEEVCDATLDCQAGAPPGVTDGVACTADSCDEVADRIVHAPDDSACDNGLFCDGAEVCDIALDCQAGTAPVADDGVGCTTDSCDENADRLVNAPDDGACDNGLFCDGVEVCDAALDCQAGIGPATDDGVSCTVDECDENSDQVVHRPDDSSCDDARFCDGAEVCHPTLDCQEGTPPILSDGVSCTLDECDEAADVVIHTPADDRCDNGLFCDGEEVCDATLDCQAGAPPAVTDGVACTADSCDEVADRIVHAPDDSACDNGLFCDGAEVCDIALDCQAGTAPVADDGVGCTTDSCDENADRIVNAPDDGACDNGLFCDGVEVCDAALDCRAGIAPATDDGVSCTVDECDENSNRVVHRPDDSSCDDARFCDGAEVCHPTLDCQEGTPPVLSDGVSCTLDECDEAADVVIHTPDDGQCDNGLFCDGEEVCHASLDCQQGAAPVLSDGVACTLDECDEATDVVLHTGDDGACDNGLFCDGAETCDSQLGCVDGPAPALGDGVGCTVDSCDEVADVVRHQSDDSLCDNARFCDGTETCHPTLGCQDGLPPETSDRVECTLDFCDEAGDAILHITDHSACDNGLFCDGAETCNRILGCRAGTAPVADDGIACTRDVCSEALQRLLHEPEDSLCDDGMFCNGREFCDPSLDCQQNVAPLVDDGIGCTADRCDEDTDQILHVAENAACDDGLFCNGREFCDPALDCLNGATPLLSDGIACTADACDEASDAILHTPDDAACADDDPCTAERCEAGVGCSSLVVPGCGLPDLSVSAVTGPERAVLGESVRSSAMASDLGPSSQDLESVIVSFLLSDDEEIDAGDRVVGECVVDLLAAGGQELCSGGVQVPQDLIESPNGEAQEFFWAACADLDMAMPEQNEANNCQLGNSVSVPEPDALLSRLAGLALLLALSRGKRRRGASRQSAL